MKEKRILFVYPKGENFLQKKWLSLFEQHFELMKITFPTLAALTPPEYEITIADEDVEPIPFDQSFDLVGLTGVQNNISRAAEIAKYFSRKGVPIACGGPSVTTSPERWRPFADILFFGEAERTWPQFCEDFLQGDYKKEYHETEWIDLSLVPVPDYSAISKRALKHYMIAMAQASRGCPFSCEFCSVKAIAGPKFRTKPIERIMLEFKILADMGYQSILISADNFSAKRKVALDLLRAMRDWNRQREFPIIFSSEWSLDVAKDDELLRLSAEANLCLNSVGIESVNPECLEETKKTPNLKVDMLESLRKFSQFGIGIFGPTVIGFDHDDLSVFEKTNEFFKKTGVVFTGPLVLQANDGAPLKERLVQEGRYRDWEPSSPGGQERDFWWDSVTVIPKQMTTEQLRRGVAWLTWQLNDYENVAKRLEIFFQDFEASPYKDSIHYLKPKMNLSGISLTLKTILRILTTTQLEDHKGLLRILATIRGSTHPQKLNIAIIAFSTALSLRKRLVSWRPESRGYKTPN